MGRRGATGLQTIAMTQVRRSEMVVEEIYSDSLSKTERAYLILPDIYFQLTHVVRFDGNFDSEIKTESIYIYVWISKTCSIIIRLCGIIV